MKWEYPIIYRFEYDNSKSSSGLKWNGIAAQELSFSTWEYARRLIFPVC